MIELRSIGRTYRRPGGEPVEALRDVSLRIERGEFVTIVGSSGSGKSTLMNVLGLLDRPDAGEYLLDGEDVSGLDIDRQARTRNRRVGFVFQAFHLLPHLTVAHNIALPLSLNDTDPAQARARLADMLAAVGLATAAGAYPRELSGGEMQRVAIARALVHRPLLVLADEPTGNLDAETAKQVLVLLREQVKRESGAGILVTHSALAAASADRVLVLTADGLHPR